MNAPPWPTNPNVGQMFQNWAWSGTSWVASPTTGLRVLVQSFTVSGSYMPSPGLVSVTVECIGGGGGSGAIYAATASQSGGSGGGGSGGYSRKVLPAALVRGGVPVTVGNGGGSDSGHDGYNGGDTMFGALCVARGGGGGQGNNFINDYGQGGGGGPAGIGDVTMRGNDGETGDTFYGDASAFANNIAAGRGGSMWGGSTQALKIGPGTSAYGRPGAANTGAGGGGSATHQAALPDGMHGADGGSGLCIVTEYCWGDRDDVNAWSPPLNVNLNWPHPPFPQGGPWPPGLPPPGPWPRSEDDC